MAEFTLATEKAKNPGMTPGLKTNLLPGGASGAAGRLRPGYIDPNAAKIGYTPAPIPERIEDQTSKGLQSFMKATADATFKYAEREATYQATQANSAFIEAARRGYGGYYNERGDFVNGFSSSQGAQAGPAYDAYVQHLDDAFDSITANLDPRAKSKALIQLQSVKNQYLSKASTHRVTQQRLADEQIRVTKRAQVVSKIVASPNLLEPDANGNLPVDPLTGLTVVDEFFGQYIKQEKANEDWAKVLRQVTETIYFESKNAGAARYFLDNIAAPRMRATGQVGVEQLTAVQNSLRSWELRELATSLDVERKLEKDAKDYEEKMQKTVYSNFVARIGTQNEPTQTELQTAIYYQITDVPATTSLLKFLYGDTMLASTPENVAFWQTSIQQSQKENGVLVGPIPDGKGGITQGPLWGAWERDPNINKRAYSKLQQAYNDRMEPSAPLVNQVMGEIEESWKTPGFEFDSSPKKSRLNNMRYSLTAAMRENPNLDYEGLVLLAHKRKFYNPDVAPTLEMLQKGVGIAHIGMPANRTALDAMLDEIEAMRGKGDHAKANEAMLDWFQWQKAFDHAEESSEIETQLEEKYNR
jgi:hypothetical protein